MKFPESRCFLAVAALVLTTFMSAPSLGNPNEGRDYSKFFNGSFWEISVRGGLSSVSEDDFSSWSVDAGLRQALPMLLADTRLSYRYDRLDGPASLMLEQHRLMVHGGIHPLYFFILGSDWLAYVISSPYLELGIGAQYGVLTTEEETLTDPGFVWSVGAGFDVPLSDPDVGYAPWLNVVYRYSGAGFDVSDGMDLNTNQHTVFLGLGWRVNGLLF